VAKKKTSKQKAPLPKEFSSSPFKNLKGLSAFTEQKAAVSDDVNREKRVDVKQATEPSEEPHSFADEMDFLGVKPLQAIDVVERAPARKADESTPQSPRLSREEREEAAFLDAIGSVEKVFKDEWPEDEPLRQAVPRRMRQVERGQLKPEAELDLHGLTVDEASTKVRFFLQDALYHGFHTILLITGKGLHSSDGPVLRQAMEKLLDLQREHVVEWGVAPRRYGGDGALVVFLRQVIAG
jgi:DNA-nicking Smr family endonuclease